VKLTLETMLEKPIDVVWRAFDNADNLKRWMPTLTDYQQLSGTPGQPGATSRLTFLENGRNIVMDETILSRREPFELILRLDTEHGANDVAHRLESMAGGQTKWTLDAEFSFKGFLRFLAPLFRGMIRKRLQDDCNRFKEMLESGALAT
jgi:uncharacterized protein YndB with AHSA1/START domain